MTPLDKFDVKTKQEKLVIGRKDIVDFPELGLYDIAAKIDTGAYTSAIHCHNVRIHKEGRRRIVSFNVLDPSHKKFKKKRYQHQLLSIKRIRNSFGQVEERCIIRTSIVLFGREFEIDISLADRSRMECPVLLGRKLLIKRFIVDVGKINLSFKHKKKDHNR